MPTRPKTKKAAPIEDFLAVPKYPKLGTPASRDFFLTFEGITRFARFLVGMASHAEHASDMAHKALLLAFGRDKERTMKLKTEREQWVGPLAHLAVHRQFVIESLLCRHIENYLNYLSALLFEIFVQRPESMKSGEKLELEFVLGHESMKSLIWGIAERKVGELSYRSFGRLVGFFQERFGIEICPEADRDRVNDAIETRNISVHNRCRINDSTCRELESGARTLASYWP